MAGRNVSSKSSNNANSRVVYCTDSGRLCPDCGQTLTQCRCKKGKSSKESKAEGSAQQQKSPSDGIVRLRRETKGRKGAGVTLVDGLNAEDDELKQIAKKLKQLCGSGGAIKNGSVEIQGDHRDKINVWLSAQGYRVKLAGG